MNGGWLFTDLILAAWCGALIGYAPGPGWAWMLFTIFIGYRRARGFEKWASKVPLETRRGW